MSKKKKTAKEISVAVAAEICGVDYQTMIQRVRSKRNPIPAHRKLGHGRTLFINMADLKKYKVNPVGWPKGRKKKDTKMKKQPIELQETDRGFEPVNERTEFFTKFITGENPPYDDHQLGAIGMSAPDLKVTRKESNDASHR